MSVSINWKDPAVTKALEILQSKDTDYKTYLALIKQLIWMGYPISQAGPALLMSAQSCTVRLLLLECGIRPRTKRAGVIHGGTNKRQRIP